MLRSYLVKVCGMWKDLKVTNAQLRIELKNLGFIEKSIDQTRFNSALNDYLLPEKPIVPGLRASGKGGFSAQPLRAIIKGLLHTTPKIPSRPFAPEFLKSVELGLEFVRANPSRDKGRPVLIPSELFKSLTLDLMQLFKVGLPIRQCSLESYVGMAATGLRDKIHSPLWEVAGKTFLLGDAFQIHWPENVGGESYVFNTTGLLQNLNKLNKACKIIEQRAHEKVTTANA
jgi:hypothetical protein